MKPKRFFYIMCGLLGLILIAGGAVYYLASRSLEQRTAQLSQRLGDEQLADQQLSQLEDLQKQYQRLQPLMPVINNALPAEKDQTRIAVELHNIAAQSGMDLNNLSFAAAPIPGPLSQTVKVGSILAIPVTFQLSGSYDQLQQFLNAQEHLDRYNSLTALNITSSQKPGNLNFDMSLNFYMKP